MKTNNQFKILCVSLLATSLLVACGKKEVNLGTITDSLSNTASNAVNQADKMTSEQGGAAAQKFDDSKIAAKVKAMFMNDGSFNSQKITIDVDKGKVSLSGSIDSKENEDKAIKLATEVEGVIEVKSNLVIPQ